MKKLPISIQTFEDVISKGMVYVDKTKLIDELIKTGKYFFLARPRRFGKSLLISTLKSFFEGREDLFRGLYIHDQIKEWKTHPIIHIDYSLVELQQGSDIFRESLLKNLKLIEDQYAIDINKTTIIKDYFQDLITQLSLKYGKVVILIDEYDKPLTDNLLKEKEFNENRNILRSFYGTMKGLDAHIRFVFLTGVSRFSKVGIFSGLNNLTDISQNPAYNSIVGFSQEELLFYFKDWLKKLHANGFDMSFEELLEHIRFWYNGFSWDGVHRLYNPFSIIALLDNLNFGNYWFASGTPTFLMDLIKERKQIPENLEGVKVTDLTGSSEYLNQLSILPLLFQTGYLTIEKVERQGVVNYYYLNYPNEEVRSSFLTYLMATFINKDKFDIHPKTLRLRDALLEEDLEDFVRQLQSIFSDIPARLHLPKEAYYHSLVYLLLRFIGMRLLLEKETDKGRIDGVLELPDKIYVLEFKFATSKRIKQVKTLSRQALQQIEKKKYYEPFLSAHKKIILFGIGFLDKEIDGKSKVLKL